MRFIVPIFIGLFFVGNLSAQAGEFSGKESSYQSGADPEYVSDDFKFSYPKSWKVTDLGEGDGAAIYFSRDKGSSMSVDTIWKYGNRSFESFSKDLKRRFGKNVYYEKVIHVNGREALLTHSIPHADKNDDYPKEDTWGVYVICNSSGISISHGAKIAFPVGEEVKKSKMPPKVFTDFLERFSCVDHKKK